MILDHKNLRRILITLDKTKVLKIYCPKNLHGVCSLFIFTQILKKEFLKFQIEFTDSQDNLYFIIDETKYSFQTDDTECTCTKKEMTCLMLLFDTVKHMDFLRVETVWPAAICHTFYRKQYLNGVFKVSQDKTELKENIANSALKEDTTEVNECLKCKEFQKTLMFSIRALNCNFEGIFYLKKINLDFLSNFTLNISIKHNLDFILDKKLLFMKSAFSERKINEFLAQKGISIPSANEEFMNLDSQIKDLIASCFGTENKFIARFGHDIEISAIEHAFLILFHLYKNKEMYAYMCLENRKLIDQSKSCKFYHKLISIFRECVLNSTKTESIVVFKFKSNELLESQANLISEIIHYFLRIYLYKRNMSYFKVLVCFSCTGTSLDSDSEHAQHLTKEMMILHSQECQFDQIPDFLKLSSKENFIKILSNNFSAVLKKLD